MGKTLKVAEIERRHERPLDNFEIGYMWGDHCERADIQAHHFSMGDGGVVKFFAYREKGEDRMVAIFRSWNYIINHGAKNPLA